MQGRTIGIYPEIKSAAATNRILAGRGEQLRSGLQFADLGDKTTFGSKETSVPKSPVVTLRSEQLSYIFSRFESALYNKKTVQMKKLEFRLSPYFCKKISPVFV